METNEWAARALEGKGSSPQQAATMKVKAEESRRAYEVRAIAHFGVPYDSLAAGSRFRLFGLCKSA